MGIFESDPSSKGKYRFNSEYIMSVQEVNSANGEELDNPGTIVEEDGMIEINSGLVGGSGGGSGGGGLCQLIDCSIIICQIIDCSANHPLISGVNTDQSLDFNTHRSSGNNYTENTFSQ